MVNLYIFRGLPGSGKTTAAKSTGMFHVEQDMFHVHKGVYSFDGQLVRRGHAWCRQVVEDALKHGLDVVVSNTFTTLWEMQAYLDMEADTHVYKFTGNYGSVHNVPQEVINKMKQRWEDYPSEIEWKGNLSE